ncbi:FAD-dependent monooxygenase [Nocardia transvalensis]|uniref:FAD-dependent monooxygenase n=1 Tax=Nocardia transvalensis TaxID=37333 RepID=UPI0018957442|nr:FAD-dependent monooxygenase [Nocardia transvalensis]MBF6331270.1 FAD-dependent monooxygenase [Nocardia transvalensis]
MSTPTTPHILVSGGGIAGNAVALQLLRAGIRVTVVERAAAPRPGGQAVDLRGPSREVADRMGLMPGIDKLRVHEVGWAYADDNGKVYARMTSDMFGGEGPAAEIEISRGDLNQVLLDLLAEQGGDLDYRYGDRIEAVDQDDHGVEVAFASGRSERFDLLVGADGVHSATRQLVFGPEERFATHLGGYMSFFTLPTPAGMEEGWLTGVTVPGGFFGIRPDRDPATAKAIIALRADADPALHRDATAQQRFIRERLADARWRAPLILDAMGEAPDFYFDELARIDMPTLSSGRVTLLGDAGFCGSPLTGMGTAMALVGAYILAGEIAAAPGDLPAALARYEQKVTPFLDKAKQLPGGGITSLCPNTRLGVYLARTLMRVVTSRPMQPLMEKMFKPRTEGYVLPSYE